MDTCSTCLLKEHFITLVWFERTIVFALQEDNLEIDLASSQRESSESQGEPLGPFEQFRMHSKSRDGPLGKEPALLDQTPGNICKEVFSPSKPLFTSSSLPNIPLSNCQRCQCSDH